jgi:hypothetical protein
MSAGGASAQDKWVDGQSPIVIQSSVESRGVST